MKALILNSGLGSRMGDATKVNPKCMSKISDTETILSHQLNLLSQFGIKDVIITTGFGSDILVDYCKSLNLPLNITFVHNDRFRQTNYIYSIDLCRDLLDDDIVLMHGDLVFDANVLTQILNYGKSCVVISSAQACNEKDFKADVRDNRVQKIGVNVYQNAQACQPLYKLYKQDLHVWLDSIHDFCLNGQMTCYAEEAFNCVSQNCQIFACDVKDQLCGEIDTPSDLQNLKNQVDKKRKTVYMCFSTDVIHSGHISILKKAHAFGDLIVGVLSDEVVASYKRYPLLNIDERKSLFENLACVSKVVEQTSLSYRENLLKFKPDYVVHGDDWQTGFQQSIREEVIQILNSYGGKLIEFPYSNQEKYRQIDQRTRLQLALPDLRRGRLRNLLKLKGLVTAIEAHSGITGLIAEKTVVMQDGKASSFDAMWVSSLCDSTAKGKPDIELVDMTSRLRTIEDIMEVTTKPIIFDGDTGGLLEHFVYNVKTLERLGVSMVIIEDKTGLKKNSLFGTEVTQTQDDIQNFCQKIKAGKMAQKSKDFMICARIESLILEKGMDDALTRAFSYVEAGADAIMIHSRKKDPAEIFEFVEKFRRTNMFTPIVVVPTSFNAVTEQEFKKRGVNIVIYANQLTRAGFPAMQKAAQTILTHHRAMECDDMCMPIKEIINLIPEEN